MKLSLAVLLFALFTTTMARSTLFDLIRRGVEDSNDGEKPVDEIEVNGENMREGIALKGDKEEADNHIAICVLEFMLNVDNKIKGKGGDDGHNDGGKGDDDGDDDHDDKQLVAKLGEKLIKRMLRIKRRAQAEPLPTNAPTRHHTSHDPSRRPEKCREGVLERFFNCLGDLDGEGEGGKHRTTAGPETKRHLNKKKFHKSVA